MFGGCAGGGSGPLMAMDGVTPPPGCVTFVEAFGPCPEALFATFVEAFAPCPEALFAAFFEAFGPLAFGPCPKASFVSRSVPPASAQAALTSTQAKIR